MHGATPSATWAGNDRLSVNDPGLSYVLPLAQIDSAQLLSDVTSDDAILTFG